MMYVFCAASDPAFSIGWSNVVRIGWPGLRGNDLPPQDPEEDRDHLLLVLTEDWGDSVHCTKQLMIAKRRRKPIYGLHLRITAICRL